jgi:hypothetical protein
MTAPLRSSAVWPLFWYFALVVRAVLSRNWMCPVVSPRKSVLVLPPQSTKLDSFDFDHFESYVSAHVRCALNDFHMIAWLAIGAPSIPAKHEAK